MNAFNYIIDKREPSDHYKTILDSILHDDQEDETAKTINIEEKTEKASPQVIPLPHNIDGFLILDALSQKECDDIISACEGAGFTFWSNPASGDEEETKKSEQSNNEKNDDEKEVDDAKKQGGNFRTAHTIEVNLPRMSRILWSRVQKLVNPVVNISEEDEETYQRDLEGTWFADRFCYNLLFARYLNGGHFAPHLDGQSVLTFNRRSMYTALFYLNDCEEGGETIFHAGDQCQALAVDENSGKVTGKNETALFKWSPKRGSCTIFRYDVLHEGAPVVPGKSKKYIIRGDVEFERKPPVCDDENGRKAFDMYERARKLEAEGDTDGAVKLFRMIRRVSPELAQILQLM